ncbi:pyridoxamine 5'-phosphate oxidase family protein [Acuticoccus sp. M5D2P5]|uniref:pyridoxamine 5'-phosphate oxidase family protein n=1 Tax=Acuticoccus kalidii TaxID=2910977 RepID=UPI001F490AEA|nr:pyridoxamine 5'-phosphate oxidase family protein [Acuticoccus kalidii]MCF3934674.1 pyridoxamine 5'-phosphate oxidase family protein [Acuticoccus kalidii]
MDEIESHQIHSEDELRSRFKDRNPLSIQKAHARLNRHDRDFIARSPFLVIGTQGANGVADASPRGDPPGFVAVIDDTTIAIPDRPGNNRLDTMTNIIENPAVGLIFLIPGFDETLRINGRAKITTAPSLLAEMAVRDRAPGVAIVVEIDEIFLHCAKAFRRSKLWDPASRQDRSEMPGLATMILEVANDGPVDADVGKDADEKVEASYERTMY